MTIAASQPFVVHPFKGPSTQRRPATNRLAAALLAGLCVSRPPRPVISGQTAAAESRCRYEGRCVRQPGKGSLLACRGPGQRQQQPLFTGPKFVPVGTKNTRVTQLPGPRQQPDRSLEGGLGQVSPGWEASPRRKVGGDWGGGGQMVHLLFSWKGLCSSLSGAFWLRDDEGSDALFWLYS